MAKVALIARNQCCCVEKVPNVSVRPWGLPLQAEIVKFGAKVHEGGGWYQPFEQVERVKQRLGIAPQCCIAGNCLQVRGLHVGTWAFVRVKWDRARAVIA